MQIIHFSSTHLCILYCICRRCWQWFDCCAGLGSDTKWIIGPCHNEWCAGACGDDLLSKLRDSLIGVSEGCDSLRIDIYTIIQCSLTRHIDRSKWTWLSDCLPFERSPKWIFSGPNYSGIKQSRHAHLADTTPWAHVLPFSMLPITALDRKRWVRVICEHVHGEYGESTVGVIQARCNINKRHNESRVSHNVYQCC